MPSPKSIYKSPDDLRRMVEPGRITALALAEVRDSIRAGITTLELDAIAEASIRAAGGSPNFLLETGYHHTVCASVNDEVVHGIPGGRVLQPGDIVSIDCGAEFEGWNGDAAFSVVIPDPEHPELVRVRENLSAVTQHSLWAGIAALATARHLNEVGAAIEDALDDRGTFGIIEEYVGHGIGRSMHEEPPVYNFRVRGHGPRVKKGLVVAIEPMVTLGGIDTTINDDGWTVVTSDHADAAHWEHSVAVHEHGIWVLTALDGGAKKLEPFGVIPVPIA